MDLDRVLHPDEIRLSSNVFYFECISTEAEVIDVNIYYYYATIRYGTGTEMPDVSDLKFIDLKRNGFAPIQWFVVSTSFLTNKNKVVGKRSPTFRCCCFCFCFWLL